jgi:hypothetical protein
LNAVLRRSAALTGDQEVRRAYRRSGDQEIRKVWFSLVWKIRNIGQELRKYWFPSEDSPDLFVSCEFF